MNYDDVHAAAKNQGRPPVYFVEHRTHTFVVLALRARLVNVA
jgi:hypothetical protein